MPGCRRDAHNVKRQRPGILQFSLDFTKRGARVREQMSAGEAHGPRVPEYISEGYCACPALSGIHEIARPGIIGGVRLPAEPDVKAVERVVEQRKVNSNRLQYRHERQAG